MRDILSKVMTGSMVAGAALLVAACGGGGSEANNTADANALGTDVFSTNDMNTTVDMNAGMNAGGTDMNAGGTTGGTDMNATGGTTGTDAGNAAGTMTGGNTTNGM